MFKDTVNKAGSNTGVQNSVASARHDIHITGFGHEIKIKKLLRHCEHEMRR